MRAVGIGAHPVVEIEEHRRTLRGCLEEVAELAEDVRPYRVPLVRRQEKPVSAFSRVDVEVVEPEINENFLQLPGAVDRADDLLLLQLEDDGGRAALLFRIRLRRAGVVLLGLLLLTSLQQRRLKLFGNLAGAHAEGRQVCQPHLDARVGESFRVQLLVDVPLDADRANMLDIARTCAERHPADRVADSPLVCWKILLSRRDADERERGNKCDPDPHRYRT